TAPDVHARLPAAPDLHHRRLRRRSGVCVRPDRSLPLAAAQLAAAQGLLRKPTMAHDHHHHDHGHDHHHHDHGHDHDHAHGHGHDDGNYFIDQLCTIAACGALGGVAVMMWYRGALTYILAPQFYTPVLIGGLALLALVAVRATSLWRAARPQGA